MFSAARTTRFTHYLLLLVAHTHTQQPKQSHSPLHHQSRRASRLPAVLLRFPEGESDLRLHLLSRLRAHAVDFVALRLLIQPDAICDGELDLRHEIRTNAGWRRQAKGQTLTLGLGRRDTPCLGQPHGHVFHPVRCGAVAWAGGSREKGEESRGG